MPDDWSFLPKLGVTDEQHTNLRGVLVTLPRTTDSLSALAGASEEDACMSMRMSEPCDGLQSQLYYLQPLTGLFMLWRKGRMPLSPNTGSWIHWLPRMGATSLRRMETSDIRVFRLQTRGLRDMSRFIPFLGSEAHTLGFELAISPLYKGQ